MARGYAASKAGGKLEPIEYEFGDLGPDDVEIEVMACGICHSDMSMLDDEWGFSSYPLVPGHEVVGKLVAVGDHVKHLESGQVVGLGWYSGSCMTCPQCMSGNHNLCPSNEATIVGRPGGFADYVRCKAEWAIPIPESMDAKKAGPLFCGGITVFNPIVQCGVRPIHRVGVVGVGGLGHLALQFLNKWGCDVTAFTSTAAKADEARRMGAHHIVDSRDSKELAAVAGSFDFILSTVAVDLQWEDYLAALAPKGRLHTVGAVPSPIPVQAFSLIPGEKSVGGSPLGSPETTRQMLEFSARHSIEVVTEHFPMSQVNEALDRLRAGKARYRIVLDADF
jgi:uncharacterized zinc-type alcohol dehydrogenase-like protein